MIKNEKIKERDRIRKGKWHPERSNHLIKTNFRKKFGTKITTPEIQKIWKDYIETYIIPNLAKGIVVKIGNKDKIWVKATPITEHKKAMALLSKGLMYRGGRIVEANINLDSSKYIYKIVYESGYKKLTDKMFFEAHPKIKKAVNESIKKGTLL